jgi:tetratricopeptide (TPR) repeat protein
MRRRSSILIRAEDHLGDSLGAIFVLEPEQYGDTVIEKLRDYLGEHAQIVKAEVSRDRIEVEVECTVFRTESDRMVETARGLRRNRLHRSAASTLHEALKLDPLNPYAMMAMAEVLQDLENFSEAVAMLIHAREASESDTPQILAMLGACCLKVERTASAIRYFENALALDPRHVGARRSLLALGRRPAVAPSKRETDEPIPTPRKPQTKH